MRHKPPRREGAEANPSPYWERQEDLHCGRHALNMILGRNVLTSNDIDREAREVDLRCGADKRTLQGFVGETSLDYVPCATGGNWDADVLLKALNSQPGVVTAEYAQQQMPPPGIYATTYIGTLIHRTAAAGGGSRVESSGGHYTCFRKVGPHLYHLDSLNAASANHAISLRDAQRLVQQSDANCWHVFANALPQLHPERQQEERPPPTRRGLADSPVDRVSTSPTVLVGDAEPTAPTAASGSERCPRTSPLQSARRRQRRNKRARGNLKPPKCSSPNGSNGDSSDPGGSLRKKKVKKGGTPAGSTKDENPLLSALTATNLAELLRQLPREVVAEALSDLAIAPPVRPASTADAATRLPDASERAQKRPRRRTRITCDFESIPENPEEEAAAEEEAKQSTETTNASAVPGESNEESDSMRQRIPAEAGVPDAVSPGSQEGVPSEAVPPRGFAPLIAAALACPGAAPAHCAVGEVVATLAGSPGEKEGKPAGRQGGEDAREDVGHQAREGGDRKVADGVADVEDVSNFGQRYSPETYRNYPAPGAEAEAKEKDSPNDTPGPDPSPGIEPRADPDAANANVPKRRRRGSPAPPPHEARRSPKREIPQRPRRRSAHRQDTCDGGGYAEPCVFSRKHAGAPARRYHGRPTCDWCSPEFATTERLSARSERRYSRAYQTFSADVQVRALSRMRPNLREVFLRPAETSVKPPGHAPRKRKDELKSDGGSNFGAKRDKVGNDVAASDAEPRLRSSFSPAVAVSRSRHTTSAKEKAVPRAHPPKGAAPTRKKRLRRRRCARTRCGFLPPQDDLRPPSLDPRGGPPPAPGYCPGPSPGARCFYSLTDPGVAAQLSPGRPTCWWCSLAEMRAADAAPPGPDAHALDFAVCHVFHNFPPSVQRQARSDSGPIIREILRRTRHLCPGAQFGNPCEFSTIAPGHPVRATKSLHLRCICCRADFASRLRDNRTFFARVRRRVYLALQPKHQAKLLERVPEHLRASMAAGPRTPGDSWTHLLGNRRTWNVYADADHAAYRAHLLNDQRRARNAFSLPKRRLRRGAAVANKTTLPVAKLPIARAFERWCEYDSWAVCQGCARMQPRDITQHMLLSLCNPPRATPPGLALPSSGASSSSLSYSPSSNSSSPNATARQSTRPASSARRLPPSPDPRGRPHVRRRQKEPKFAAPAIDSKQCSNCSARRPHEVPAPGDVPEPLRNLELPVLTALSPLEIFTGPLVRANVRPSSLPGRKRHDQLATGYRQHTSMIRFAWYDESVDSRVAELQTRSLRAKGTAALAFLKASRDSDYHEFYREHQTFLRRQTAPAAGSQGRENRLLSLAFIERPGLECALWPHLFWRRDLCFSHERASDPRRGRERQRAPTEKNRGDAGEDLLLPTPPSPAATVTPRGHTAGGDSDCSNNSSDSTSNSSSNGRAEGADAPLRRNKRASKVRRAKRKKPSDGLQGKRRAACRQIATGAPAISRSPKGRSEPQNAPAAAKEVRHSAKGSFAAKALGPLLDYGNSFEILQYVYDLTMWSSIGSKRTVGDERVPLRLMMKGYPFNPLYWRSLHLALVDMVRQLGPPVIFWTFAPYEWSFPYHVWIRDAMSKQLRGRLFLPVGETLHLAHVMSQVVRGLLTGRSHGDPREGGRWTRHLLAARHPRSGAILDLPFFARLEFQDGTRKAATQDYHGSGRPHVHVLIFCEHPEVLPIGDAASATLSDARFHATLGQYVFGSQRDQTRASGRDVSLEGTHYDRASATWRLYHTPKDKAAGLRAYFPVIMDSLKCHQDLQLGTGKGLLAAYVAKYVSKFSSSALDEWLSDYLEANAVAANFLYRFKPFEPEMILQIFGQRFRQWDISTDSRGKRDFRVPLPGAAAYPSEITQYIHSDWRSDKMSLLDFLRKTNNAGAIAGWLQQKYKKQVKADGSDKSGGASNGGGPRPAGSSAPSTSDGSTRRRAPPQSLATFAASYNMRGEQVVAADMHSRASDTFYGQWMMLHVPFRNPDDLLNRDITRRVPKHLQFLANALFSNNPVAQKFWRNDYRVKAEMESEGHGAAHIESLLSMIRANRDLITDYMEGAIADADGAQPKKRDGDADNRGDREEYVRQGLVAPTTRATDGGNGTEGGIIRAPLPDMADLNPQQRHFVRLLNAHMELTANIGNIRTAEARESHVAHQRSSKVVICMGPPGTGKTTAARLSIQVALDLGGQVLLALPTAQLASNLRTYYVGEPRVVIDTCAAAFGLMEDPCENLPHVGLFSLIMIDEFSQLSKIQFERIVKLWASVDKLPALVFCGDPYQMSGFGTERPWHSRLWRLACNRVHLVQAYRCKDPQFWAKLSALRIAEPSEVELRALCAKRKAWDDYPTVRKIRRHLKRFPQTTILTCTRRGTHVLNNLVLRAFFPKQKPLTYLPGDIDTNPENYLRDGSMKPAAERRSLWMPIFVNMKICITQNVRKEADFVNGMVATVECFYPESLGLRVRTATGRCLVIYKWTNPREPEIAAHYPIRPGYASTIMKYQGAELAHVTVYLDAKNVPGAAYTALSRVQSGRQYRLAGTGRLDPGHFTPADVTGLH